ncbi:M48 family metallopeptidase [Streptoalloteichus hindustanus]|uniref:Zn-dependent protease with chaperone function n=1 Tax=Streptoalloteichus hindustanus TaxID=2017 RepID=A0A1M4W9T1_STRHI|nr:M48 family metallopeptidase [Streptoalloteichus hindustanus]SHE77969.1 Zn-dependent protease with chaperone function [Streptoalloteichus hindustanus]
MRSPWRAVLALTVLVGFFACAAVLAAGLAGAALYAMADGDIGMTAIELLLCSALLGTAVGLFLPPVLRVRHRARGHVVDRAAQPELWEVIDELAGIARSRPPDELRVVPGVRIAFWEDAPVLGLVPGHRCLEVGLPLLGGLTVAELRAVLAHELAHLGDREGRPHAVAYRATALVEQVVADSEGDWRRPVLRAWGNLVLSVAAPVNQRQEQVADEAAVAAAGVEAACAAFRRMAALERAWSDYGQQYLAMAPIARRTPDVLLGFRSYLSAPRRQREWAELEDEALDAGPSGPHDRHAPLRERIEAMRAAGGEEPEADDRPAWSLLTSPGRSVPELEDALLVDLGPRAPWPELVRAAVVRKAEDAARRLSRAVLDSGVRVDGRAAQTTVAGVLLAVHRGLGCELVKPALDPGLAPGEVSAASDALLVELLGGAVTAALCRTGRARPELNWDGPCWLRLASGQVVDVERLVGPAVRTPGLVPQLHRHLVRIGVPLDFAARPAEPPEPELVASANGVRCDGDPHDVRVYDSGLLVLPAGSPARKPLPELRRRPGARWVCGHDVEWARLVHRQSGWDVWLQLRGGDELELTSASDTAHDGDPQEGMARLLGDRLEVEDVRQRRREPVHR